MVAQRFADLLKHGRARARVSQAEPDEQAGLTVLAVSDLEPAIKHHLINGPGVRRRSLS